MSGTSITPVAGTSPSLSIATPGGAGSANLNNIVPSNLRDGTWLALRIANAGQVVVLKHAAGGSGQLSLQGAADFALSDLGVVALLELHGTTWTEVGRFYGGTQGAAHRAFYGAAGLGQNRFTGRQEWNKGADLTAASTLVLGTDGNFFSVNGSATINGLSVAPAGARVTLLFIGLPLLVHSTTFQLGGQNIQAQPGTVLDFVTDGGGLWRLTSGGGGVGVINRDGSTITIQNRTDERGLFFTNLPAGTLGPGNAVRLVMQGLINADINAIFQNRPNLFSFKVYLGGGFQCGIPLNTLLGPAGIGPYAVLLNVGITLRVSVSCPGGTWVVTTMDVDCPVKQVYGMDMVGASSGGLLAGNVETEVGNLNNGYAGTNQPTDTPLQLAVNGVWHLAAPNNVFTKVYGAVYRE